MPGGMTIRFKNITPCIKLCNILANGTCQGCYRTIAEITNWKDYTMSQRMQIMQQLESRKQSLMKGSPCPSCGLDNNCAIDSGKSSTLCWCMTEDVSNKPLTDIGNCYCKQCLKGEP